MGLYYAGKTTILCRYGADPALVAPTVSYNAIVVSHRNYNFSIFDIGGYPVWWHYSFLAGTRAVIFVIDSSDSGRLDEAREELERRASMEEVRDAVFLVLANKQDKEEAMATVELRERLKLDDLLKDKRWSILGTSALKGGESLMKALDWICAEFDKE